MSIPVVLSASSINTFKNCGQRWYYEYVLLWDAPTTDKQALGIAVHAAVECGMSFKFMTGGEDPDIDTYIAWFDDEFNLPEPEMREEGHKLMRLFATDIGPRINPMLIERPVQFTVNGIPYSGVIDLVDDRGRIRDWKTTGSRPRPTSYQTNMVGYALGYRHMTGETETEVVLDYLVRTKTPKYVPIASGGPISDTAINHFVSQLEYVADMIDDGSFPANGITSGACRWCPFTSKCEAYQQRMVSNTL